MRFIETIRERKRRAIIVTILVVVVVAGLVVWRVVRPARDVEVIHPQRREVVEVVVASGRIRARRQSDVGAAVTGAVESVLAEEGDRVTPTDTLIILERQEVEQELAQARSAVETARRRLAVVQRGALPEEIERARAELRQAERVGQARVDTAQQRLAELERGGREEDRRRAEAELQRARAARRQAELDLQRAEALLARGAIAEAEVDRARTALAQARAAEAASEQQLALARQPGSPEEIAAARAEVRAATADMQESVRAARAILNRLLSEPQPEDVQLAQAQLREAQAAVRTAEERLARRTIRSPIGGIVVRRDVEPGQSVTPGQRLMVVADMDTAEVYLDTDEDNLPKLRRGQGATVVAPAYPNRPFRAVVTQIGPEVDPARGVVVVRLRSVALPDYARPDITVDASIEVARLPAALSVPVSSVLERQDQTYVLVAEDGVARRRDVQVLARGSRWVGVDGVSPADDVIVDAAGVDPGDRVRVAARR